MKTNKKNMRSSAGFTLVELMLSITIAAFLLTAVAFALRASSDNYQANRDISRTINTAMQALSRITTELRTANAVEISEPNSQCSFQTSQGQNITYLFDSSQQKLYLVTNDDTTDDDYILCENVTQAEFTRETAFDDSMTEYVQSVQISISITIGTYSNTFASAVTIRKNL
ncbi:MAG: type II secretion system GspH family protein [Anaerohalosphaeraceae bacterium]|nr:type II secretion system GspH family protein [Anaerohalosphaeraceae bacterium]